jgi:hypothetical protein
LWLLAAWATKRAIANLQSAEANQRAILEASLLSWAGVSLAAVFVGGRFFGHYFIQLLPALSIFAGQGAQLLNVNLLNETKRRKARIFVGFFLLCLLVNVARFHRRTAILAYETLIGKRTSYSQKWGMTEREDEAAIIAQKVREQLNAGDPLYIWGYALDVYWRTGCPPASRFITPNHITGEFEGASGSIAEADHPFWSASRRQFIEDLRRNCPRLILDVTGELVSLPYEDIRTFIEENYRRDGEIGITPTRPFIVYRRLSP